MYVNNDDIKAEIINNNDVRVIIRFGKCPSCDYKMVNFHRSNLRILYELFPYFVGANFEAQLKSVNIRLRGNSMLHSGGFDDYICEVCDEEGKGGFTCDLCGEQRNSKDKEESFGWPPEILCKHCFSTVTAEVWNKRCESLREAHSWDFE